jgi:hypothetical protein
MIHWLWLWPAFGFGMVVMAILVGLARAGPDDDTCNDSQDKWMDAAE